MDKVDSNLSLHFWAEKGHTDSPRARLGVTGDRAMSCELSFHAAQAIQAGHRPSYGLELLKHGEMWVLLTVLSWVSSAPNSCSTMLGACLLHSLPVPAALLVGVRFVSWLADPSRAGQQKPLVLLALWKGWGQGAPGRTRSLLPRHKDKKWFWNRKQGPAGNCNSFCDRGRLWALLEEQTWKVFLVAGAGLWASPRLFLVFLPSPGSMCLSGSIKAHHADHTVDTRAHQPLLAMPTHRTLGASQIRMGRWASWSPRGCWHWLETDTDSLGPGPQWQGTCPKLRLPTAARPVSLCFMVGGKESWRKQSQYVNWEQKLSLPNSCSTLGG